MDEFKLNEAGTHYEHVVGFNGENTRASTDGDNVELFYSVKDEAVSAFNEDQQKTIYLSAQRHINFSCSYSLDTQTVSTNVDVTGKDIEITRAATGQLHFKMISPQSSSPVNIGSRFPFSIVPTTPGAVYYTTKNCKVRDRDNSDLSYSLIYDAGNGQCTDFYTDVTLDSDEWCTSGQQDFSYTSFKFDSTGARGSTTTEKQAIYCDIELSMEKNYDYNPRSCNWVDECAAGTHNCSDHGKCETNNDGSFSCNCDFGYGGSTCTECVRLGGCEWELCTSYRSNYVHDCDDNQDCYVNAIGLSQHCQDKSV